MVKADDDEILLSSGVKKTVPQVLCNKENEFTLKGIKGKFTAFTFEKVAERRKSKREKLIGKQKEIEKYNDYITDKNDRLVLVTAEAGLGKSVLANSFFEICKKKYNNIAVGCYSYSSNIPYYSVKEVIKKHIGINSESNFELNKERLKLWLRNIGEEENFIYLASFLDLMQMPEEAVSDSATVFTMEEIIISVFTHILSILNIAVFIDDSHWMDNSSFNLICRVVERLESENYLLHLIYRPDKRFNKFSKLKENLTFTLESLNKEEAYAFIVEKFSIDQLSGKLFNTIFSTTRGNPFFIEEIIIGVKNSGNLIPAEENGVKKYRFRKNFKLEVPDNLNEMILSRIDKLDEKSKMVLKIASVVGRTFKYETLKQLDDLKKIVFNLDLGKTLLNLNRLDLTLFEGDEFDEYLFKHVITRDVTYQTILYSLRREYHNKIAQLFEEKSPEEQYNYYELLAGHYRLAENRDKAKKYIWLSALKAKNNYAHNEALNYIHIFRKYKLSIGEKIKSFYEEIKILKDIGKNDQSIIVCDKALKEISTKNIFYNKIVLLKADTYFRKGDYTIALEVLSGVTNPEDNDIHSEKELIKGYCFLYLSRKEEKLSVYKDFTENINKIKDKPLKIKALAFMANVNFYERDFQEAINLFKKVYTGAKKISNNHFRIWAVLNMGSCFGQMGEYKRANERFIRSFKEAGKIHHHELLLRSLDGLAKVNLVLGDYERAVKYIDKGKKILSKTKNIVYLELILQTLANIKHEQGKYDEVIEICAKREDIVHKTRDLRRLNLIKDLLGDALFQKKEYRKAITVYKENLKLSEKINNIETQGHTIGNLANCYAEMRNYSKAIELYNKQLEYAVRYNDRQSEGKVLHNLAYLYIHDIGDFSEGEKCLIKTEKIFNEIGYAYGLKEAEELRRIFLTLKKS